MLPNHKIVQPCSLQKAKQLAKKSFQYYNKLRLSGQNQIIWKNIQKNQSQLQYWYNMSFFKTDLDFKFPIVQNGENMQIQVQKSLQNKLQILKETPKQNVQMIQQKLVESQNQRIFTLKYADPFYYQSYQQFMKIRKKFSRKQNQQIWSSFNQQRRNFFTSISVSCGSFRGEIYCQMCPVGIKVNVSSYRRHLMNMHFRDIKNIYDQHLAQTGQHQYCHKYIPPKIIKPTTIIQRPQMCILTIQPKISQCSNMTAIQIRANLRNNFYPVIYQVQIQQSDQKILENQYFQAQVGNLKTAIMQRNSTDVAKLNMAHAISFVCSFSRVDPYATPLPQACRQYVQAKYKSKLVCLQKKQQCSLQQSIKNLHTTRQDRAIYGRTRQLNLLNEYAKQYFGLIRVNFLHVWGRPGTGKTSCIEYLCRSYVHMSPFTINAFMVNNKQMFFKILCLKLGIQRNKKYEGYARDFLQHNRQFYRVYSSNLTGSKTSKARLFIIQQADHLPMQVFNILKQCPFTQYIVVTNSQCIPLQKQCNKSILFHPYSAQDIRQILVYKLGSIKLDQSVLNLIINKSARDHRQDLRKCLTIVSQVLQIALSQHVKPFNLTKQVFEMYLRSTDMIQSGIRSFNVNQKKLLYRICQLQKIGMLPIHMIVITSIMLQTQEPYKTKRLCKQLIKQTSIQYQGIFRIQPTYKIQVKQVNVHVNWKYLMFQFVQQGVLRLIYNQDSEQGNNEQARVAFDKFMDFQQIMDIIEHPISQEQSRIPPQFYLRNIYPHIIQGRYYTGIDYCSLLQRRGIVQADLTFYARKEVLITKQRNPLFCPVVQNSQMQKKKQCVQSLNVQFLQTQVNSVNKMEIQ